MKENLGTVLHMEGLVLDKDDKLFYDEKELGSDVEGFMADESLLKKFRSTFGQGDGLDVFEYIIDRLCHTFDVDITSERMAYKKEIGLELWQLAYKADVEICYSYMNRCALKYQADKLKQLNVMKVDQE